jgi:hypothetical protein
MSQTATTLMLTQIYIVFKHAVPKRTATVSMLTVLEIN